ncbi:hypothetical protein BC936DRAFT_136667 [Jimgerdemannia flammicorona]|uniref:site-specific DNA-methyltransferase (adenine-specific) n=1 Tax=Jimgerdemannia flammicorona TaxID=994334 RepID=A0A433CZ23_9FUNG|nr:hypothetical protein BC936DRAFT_136667 [Jimgerdemannia flammicorona]
MRISSFGSKRSRRTGVQRLVEPLLHSRLSMCPDNPYSSLELLEAAAIQVLQHNFQRRADATPPATASSSSGELEPHPLARRGLDVTSSGPARPNDPAGRKRKWLDVVLNDRDVEVDPSALATAGDGYAGWFPSASRLPTPPTLARSRNREFTWVSVTPALEEIAASIPPAPRQITRARAAPFAATAAYPSPPTHHITAALVPAVAAPQIGQLTELQTRTVVEHLGFVLADAKRDVLERLRRMDDGTPSPALPEINRLLLQQMTSLPAASNPPISSPSHLRSLLSEYHSSPTSHDHAFRFVIDFYALMTAFMSVYQMFFEALVTDLVGDVTTATSSSRDIASDFLACFDDADNFLLSGEMDPYMWHYHAIHHTIPASTLPLQLRQLLHASSIRFTTLSSIETIFSTFYTEHFLEVAAQRHQKDHGQFYTPNSVVRFMWDRCLDPVALLFDLLSHLDHHPPAYPTIPLIPLTLDPCMGIGGFLCEYATRVIAAARSAPLVWDSAHALTLTFRALCDSLWGVEIDGFAFHLGKVNLMVHLIPLYRRYVEVSLPAAAPRLVLPRLHLFRNDTLRLTLPEPGAESEWEHTHLRLLRDPERLRFRYVVTNPPYMIRKTGFIAQPDPSLYDERVLGGRGMQAYMYFLWVCLQRVEPERGQVCLVTPSQWIVLEFADRLRSWIWDNCHLEEFFQFEPFKVWPKIQTDSLVFKLRRRHTPLSISFPPPLPPLHTPIPRPIAFLRHTNRKSSLDDILRAYTLWFRQGTNPATSPSTSPSTSSLLSSDPDMQAKCTPPPPRTTISTTHRASFAFLVPTSSSVADRLRDLTAHLPRICDGDTKDIRAPLVWHRGPNTHPVYALVVRTRWAREQFGEETCRRWLRPVFYWNGKSDPASSAAGGGEGKTPSKEVQFWHGRDALRLTKKESSPAEAYMPFREEDDDEEIGVGGAGSSGESAAFYSLIMVDREGAERLRKEEGEEGRLWRYLREARVALQPEKVHKEVAWCHFNQCGVDVPVKIVHPINFGYFTKSQPRQRFFLDTDRRCVTNQCIYFTVKPSHDPGRDGLPYPSHLFFLGLLNSTTLQHLIITHCSYDQQGRTRFFGKKMAGIPYAPPPAAADVQALEVLVARTLDVRRLVIRIAGRVRMRSLVEKMRRGMWTLNEQEVEAARRWMDEGRVMETGVAGMRDGTAERDRISEDRVPTIGKDATDEDRLVTVLKTLLRASSFLQHAVDQFVYRLYRVAPDLQISLEEDLAIELGPEWADEFPRGDLVGEEDVTAGPAQPPTVFASTCMPSWGWKVARRAEEAVEEAMGVLSGRR